MAEHSKFSASNYEADSLCPGRRIMNLRSDWDAQELGKIAGVRITARDGNNFYADEGTAAHWLLEQCLKLNESYSNFDAHKFVGLKVEVREGVEIEIDDDMAEYITEVTSEIITLAGQYEVLLPESRVNYASFLKVYEPDAWGTADAIAITDNGAELQVHDLKYGRGKEVFAAENPQLMLYALGALNAVRLVGDDPERVRMFIHQPRIKSAPSEYDMSVAELEEWAEEQAEGSVIEQLDAEEAFRKHVDNRGSFMGWAATYLKPGPTQCNFCIAKGVSCPQMTAGVVHELKAYTPAAGPEEFEDLSGKLEAVEQTIEEGKNLLLSNALDAVDMIELWCRAVRTEAEALMLAGERIPEWKLVQGRAGNRAWVDEAEAEEMMKGFRLKTEEMYNMKPISPTQAEKLAKDKTIGPRQWKKLEQLITRSDPKLHVAPDSDKRQAIDIQPVVDDFEDVSQTAEDDPLC